MELESLSNLFAYASFICSFSFWLGLILSRIPAVASLINVVPPMSWLVIEGVGIVLAGFSAVSRSKLWPLAIPLSLGSFFFVMYVIGS
jgi:hypothetical protein